MKTGNYLYKPTGACCQACATGDASSFATTYRVPLALGAVGLVLLLLSRRKK